MGHPDAGRGCADSWNRQLCVYWKQLPICLAVISSSQDGGWSTSEEHHVKMWLNCMTSHYSHSRYTQIATWALWCHCAIHKNVQNITMIGCFLMFPNLLTKNIWICTHFHSHLKDTLISINLLSYRTRK